MQCANNTIFKCLHQLGFVNRRGREEPHELTRAQHDKRVAICKDLLARYDVGLILDEIVMCDGKWILYDNREAEMYWIPRGSTAKTTSRRGPQGRKVMLCVWWCSVGVIHFELVPDGHAINVRVYSDQLQRAHDRNWQSVLHCAVQTRACFFCKTALVRMSPS